MNVKKLIWVLIVCLMPVLAHAQAKIYKKTGEVIEANIKTISTDVIVFKKADVPDGPEYTIPKADVLKIVYANGTEDIFDEDQDRIGVKSGNKTQDYIKINNNTIQLAPFQFTVNGVGVGAAWERTLEPGGAISLYIPVMLTFNSIGNDAVTGSNIYDAIGYIMPGVKFYTNLNSSRRGKFSIEPCLLFGYGSGLNTVANPYYSGADYNQNEKRVLMGTAVNFGMNMFTAKNLYIGYDFGVGMNYVNDYGSSSSGFGFIALLSFRVGYRFHTGKTPQQQN